MQNSELLKEESQVRNSKLSQISISGNNFFVIPTLNEEAGIGQVIEQIKNVFASQPHQIIVVDGNSRDQTVAIARKMSALVIQESGPKARRGYGNALMTGFNYVMQLPEASETDIVVMLDADCTYLPRDIPLMIHKLRDLKAGMVIGDRFAHMANGAMTLRNLFGNKMITLFLNVLYNKRIADSQCGMRAMTVDALRRMQLFQNGMPFATEMLMEAKKKRIKVAQVPINYEVRAGKPKLSPILDGLRIVVSMFDHFTGHRKTKFFHEVQALLPAIIAPFDWVLKKVLKA